MKDSELFELGNSDSSSRPRRKARPKSSTTPILVGIVVALAVIGIGFGIYFGTHSDKKPNEVASKTDGKGRDEPKDDPKAGKVDAQSPKQPNTPITPKKQPKTDENGKDDKKDDGKPKDLKPAPLVGKKEKPDRRWVAEAHQELLDALKAKIQRASSYQQRIGAMNEGEYQMNVQAARFVKEAGPEGYANVPDELKRRGALIDASGQRGIQREAFVRSPEYADLVKSGAVQARLPWQKRKELYEKFADITGNNQEWGLGCTFDDFNEDEMKAVIDACAKAKANGLGKLTKDQRLLILKARALDFFTQLFESGK